MEYGEFALTPGARYGSQVRTQPGSMGAQRLEGPCEVDCGSESNERVKTPGCSKAQERQKVYELFRTQDTSSDKSDGFATFGSNEGLGTTCHSAVDSDQERPHGHKARRGVRRSGLPVHQCLQQTLPMVGIKPEKTCLAAPYREQASTSPPTGIPPTSTSPT